MEEIQESWKMMKMEERKRRREGEKKITCWPWWWSGNWGNGMEEKGKKKGQRCERENLSATHLNRVRGFLALCR